MKEWPNKAVCNKDWFIDCSVDLLLQFPDNLPCSVALQPAAHDVGKVRTWRRNRSDEVNASQDGDTSSLFFFCSNVPWSLRSKRSALRARMLKYANGESQREAWGVHHQLHLPLNRRRTVAEWKKISLLRFQFFIWLFALSRSMVKLMLRKVQYAPEGEGVAPSVETTRDFVMSDKPLHVKASLDKEVRCCTNTQNTTWFWHFLPAHTKTFSSCRKERTSFQYQHPKSKNSPDQKTHHTPASQMKKLIYEFCLMIMKHAAFYIPLISTLKRKLFFISHLLVFTCVSLLGSRSNMATGCINKSKSFIVVVEWSLLSDWISQWWWAL